MRSTNDSNKELQAETERLRFALDSFGAGEWELNLIDHTAQRSLQHDRIFGYRELLPSWTYEMFLEHVIPEDRDEVDRKFSHALATQSDWHFECRIMRCDNVQRWIRACGHHIVNEQGVPLRMMGVVEDITVRRHNEEALRTSEQLYRAIGESIDYGVWVCTPDGRNIYASDSFLRLVGITQEQCSNFGWGDVLHPDDAERTIAAWKECVRTQGAWDIEHRFRGVDGQWHPILARGVPVKNECGEVTCWAGINLDISRIKRVEDDLRQIKEELELRVDERTTELLQANHRLSQEISERKQAEIEREQYFRLFMHSSDIMVIADPNGAFLRINPAGTEILGYSEAELLSKPFIDFIHPDDKQSTLNEMARQQTLGFTSAFENRYICKDGSCCWLSWRAAYHKSDKCTYATARDITERKQQEEALRRSEQEFRMLTEAMPQIVWATRRDGWNTYFNQKWMDYTGMTLEESYGHGWNKPFHPDDQQRAWDAWQKATTHGATYSLECRLRRYDGVYKWWLVRGVPVLDEEGTILKWFGTCTDIDEFKKAEEERLSLERQLLQSQKLESLGVLAGGIAHDFNNILMAIIGNADLAMMRINKESPAVDNLHRIEQAAARAADLAKQMLAYSGKGKFVIEQLDLNTVLEEMLHMLEVSISKKAVLQLNLHHPLPSIEADGTQIRQIIMNLVINASEAIGDASGVIAITTGFMECDRRYLNDVWLDENLTDGLHVYLEISDNGCGMDKETVAKMFDPFFSTKFTGRGLGMAAVLGIVRGHKGAIKVYSEPNRGTTFKVIFPASNRLLETPPPNSLLDAWQGSGTVLLVDDEETVRSIGTEMLHELGFSVITAADGKDALKAFKNNPEIAFVILDLTMPQMDGELCFRELQKLNPDVKIIMSSGYNKQEVTQKFVGKGLAGFIQKPYRLSVLKAAIQSITG